MAKGCFPSGLNIRASFIIFFWVILGEYCSAAPLVPAVFIFGDSLVDVGNNNYLKFSLRKANFPHNGVDFPTHKPTGRFSNGKNAADFVSEKVGLPTSPPYLSLLPKFGRRINSSSFSTGVSFASGGAGILEATNRVFNESLSFSVQVDYFATVRGDISQQLGPSALQNHLSKSLFGIVIGSNDILGYSTSSKIRKTNTPQQYLDLMLVALKSQLQRLCNYGARKFVVLGLPVIGCCPSQRLRNMTECNEETNSWAVKYNDGLKLTLQQLKSQFKDMHYSYFDIYGAMKSIIQNPSRYGFAEVKAACCGMGHLRARLPCLPIAAVCSNRRDHVFWDFYHPTEATAQIIVDSLFEGSSQYAFPIDLKKLIAL